MRPSQDQECPTCCEALTLVNQETLFYCPQCNQHYFQTEEGELVATYP